MAYFCFHCRDGEYGEKLRALHRSAHMSHMKAVERKYALAGPLMKGDDVIGSLLVIKASDEAEARQILEADPYFIQGVWQSIRVDGFTPLLGDWADAEGVGSPDQS